MDNNAEADASRVNKASIDELMASSPTRTVSYSGRNSTHSTFTPARASSASYCSKGNDLSIVNRHDTPRGETSRGVSPVLDEQNNKEESVSTREFGGNRESYIIEDSAKEYVITGVGLVKPEKLETRKVRPLGALMKRHKKTT